GRRCPPPRVRGWCANTSQSYRSDRSIAPPCGHPYIWQHIYFIPNALVVRACRAADRADQAYRTARRTRCMAPQAGTPVQTVGSSVNKLLPMTSISIPSELLPADGRFGCGPSKVRNEQIAYLSAL